MTKNFFVYIATSISLHFKLISRYVFIFGICVGLNLSILSFVAAKDEINWKQTGKILVRAYQDAVEKSFVENKQAFDSRFKWNNKINLKDNIFFNINFEGRSENFLGGVTEENMNFFLREAFVEKRYDNFSFSVGQQKVTWGKLDDVIVLDRITPQDFQWFTLFDKQERKLPTLMLKHNYYAENWRLESVFLPTFSPSKVDFFGSDWAVFGRLKQGIERDSFSDSIKSTIRGITIEDKDRLTDHSLKNSQFATRLSSRFHDVDYSLYYMYIYNSMPTLREKTQIGNAVKKFLYDPTLANLNALTSANPNSEDLTLEKEYPRTNIIGLDWETVLGEYGLRGEMGVFWGLPYLRRDFSYTTKDALSFGIGIDHTTANNFYFNIQFIENYILDYEDLFAQEKSTQQFTGTLTQRYLKGNLIFNFDWAWNASRRDWMLNPEMRYKFRKGFDLALGGFVFEGALDSIFGRYSAKDLIYLEMQYQF